MLTGLHWIDPNGGSIEDAIEVNCNRIDNVEWTCIKPEQKVYVRYIIITDIQCDALLYTGDRVYRQEAYQQELT